EPLALPSDFAAVERDSMGIEGLAVFERRVRTGHAYDLLDAVKLSINHQGAFLEDKRKHARGQKDNTRSQKKVTAATTRTRMLAGLYNYNRDRLLILCNPDASEIPPAIDLKQDLKSKNWRKPRQLGDSHEEPAWIWTAVPPWTTKAEAEAWELEVERVQWFRARAEKARVNEEINKLHAEFKRTTLGFRNMSAAWEAVSLKDGMSPGARAYAKRKTAMFKQMSTNSAAAFAATRRDPGEKWDYSFV
ncbi:uncharacterized protein B0H18DRAFT_832381, partial [Fomitopsis serialis]|uniref:uncharacterized protein n=1 Tax=Fomitopsis serialis TaxID=139415 RepID=UPI0020081499